MSYEAKMLQELKMPNKIEVGQALLKTLFMHNGVIKEFATGEQIVDEIANIFSLSENQRVAYLETIYRKENRVKKSMLWHRLLFRAADYLSKEKLVSRPTQTVLLTDKREWMLTEKGFDEALKLLKVPLQTKDSLSTKSYEVQKIVKKIINTPRPKEFDPFDTEKKVVKITKETILRGRGFRQAVLEAYDYKCSVCGMKINSPNSLLWEVEAAHIVPHSYSGKDNILNGLALCRLHHWAFDVGWFSIKDNFQVEVSSKINSLPAEYGKIGSFDVFKSLSDNNAKLFLPIKRNIYPHQNSIRWHREHIFHN